MDVDERWLPRRRKKVSALPQGTPIRQQLCLLKPVSRHVELVVPDVVCQHFFRNLSALALVKSVPIFDI